MTLTTALSFLFHEKDNNSEFLATLRKDMPVLWDVLSPRSKHILDWLWASFFCDLAEFINKMDKATKEMDKIFPPIEG